MFLIYAEPFQVPVHYGLLMWPLNFAEFIYIDNKKNKALLHYDNVKRYNLMCLCESSLFNENIYAKLSQNYLIAVKFVWLYKLFQLLHYLQAKHYFVKALISAFYDGKSIRKLFFG